MGFAYSSRLSRLQEALGTADLDAALFSVGADLPYLTGYEAMPLERLTMLTVTADRSPILVVPEIEAPRVKPQGDAFDILPWSEWDDPVAIVSDLLRSCGQVAVGDQTWSMFLLALQSNVDAQWSSATELTRPMRMRKDEAEIELLRQAAHAVDRVCERLAGYTFSGRTERQVSHDVFEMTVEEGHQVAEYGIVASGPNGASPHHEAGDRVIGEGDAVVVDFGGRLGGYASDTTRNFVVGEPPDGYAGAFGVLHEAQQKATEAVKPGVTAESIDRAARKVIEDAGYGEAFIHRTGHGIGLEIHEHPYIIEGNDQVLEPGMTFSIEPGIYLPDRFGMRIEDIVAVTEDGVESLNVSNRQWVTVG